MKRKETAVDIVLDVSKNSHGNVCNEVLSNVATNVGFFKCSRLKFSTDFQDTQKQPLEMFCKKRCSQKFRKFHRKTPVLETPFNKLQS